MTGGRLRAVLASAALAAACDDAYEGAGDLRADRVVLEREVEGLRPIVARLERGEPLLPADDIAVAIDDALSGSWCWRAAVRCRHRSLPRAADRRRRAVPGQSDAADRRPAAGARPA
ncbi:MAG: hypothetical protein R2708_23445 [Vicinamibacterales bacterium]